MATAFEYVRSQLHPDWLITPPIGVTSSQAPSVSSSPNAESSEGAISRLPDDVLRIIFEMGSEELCMDSGAVWFCNLNTGPRMSSDDRKGLEEFRDAIIRSSDGILFVHSYRLFNRTEEAIFIFPFQVIVGRVCRWWRNVSHTQGGLWSTWTISTAQTLRMAEGLITKSKATVVTLRFNRLEDQLWPTALSLLNEVGDRLARLSLQGCIHFYHHMMSGCRSSLPLLRCFGLSSSYSSDCAPHAQQYPAPFSNWVSLRSRHLKSISTHLAHIPWSCFSTPLDSLTHLHLVFTGQYLSEITSSNAFLAVLASFPGLISLTSQFLSFPFGEDHRADLRIFLPRLQILRLKQRRVFRHWLQRLVAPALLELDVDWYEDPGDEHIPSSDSPSFPTIPNPQILYSLAITGCSSQEILQFLQHCPNLGILVLKPKAPDMHVLEALTEGVGNIPAIVPRLRSLGVCLWGFFDGPMEILFEKVKSLIRSRRALDAPVSAFSFEGQSTAQGFLEWYDRDMQQQRRIPFLEWLNQEELERLDMKPWLWFRENPVV